MKRIGWLWHDVIDIENVFEAMLDYNRNRPKRIMRNVDAIRRRPMQSLYRSLMSRLGWLKAIHMEHNAVFAAERKALWR